MIGGRTLERVCDKTGFALVQAAGESGWRVTKDRHVVTDGVTGARINNVVGPLQPDAEDSRCRYDTMGRTVYFGESEKVSLAESLQALRSDLMSMVKDARAIGEDVTAYRDRITADFHQLGLPGPGEIPVQWQMSYSIYKVVLPRRGWWVRIDSSDTLNALSLALRGDAGQLTLGHVCGEDRGLTTKLAQTIRDSILDDGELPLGIAFPSKTGYGRCWAWWNRRADDDSPAGSNDPKPQGSTNVNIPALTELAAEWKLKFVGVAS